MNKEQYKPGTKIKDLKTGKITTVFDLGYSKCFPEVREPDGVWINSDIEAYALFRKFEEVEIL